MNTELIEKIKNSHAEALWEVKRHEARFDNPNYNEDLEDAVDNSYQEGQAHAFAYVLRLLGEEVGE